MKNKRLSLFTIFADVTSQIETTILMLSLYFHWPFCAKKCPYCDYNTHVRKQVDYQHYLTAYQTALNTLKENIGMQSIPTIFFGGGTPSLMPAWLVGEILNTVNQYFHVANNCEITLEANPTHIEAGQFSSFKTAGINRVSVGVQSLNDADLKWLGRQHSGAEAITVMEQAAKTFDKWSADFIYGLPASTDNTIWEHNLKTALDIGAQHISCYQLTVMEDTPLYRYHQRGDFTLPGDDRILAIEAITKSLTQQYGLNHYEISSYGAENHHCRHNEHYWAYRPYAGIGPGAHGRVLIDNQLVATNQAAHPEKWLQAPGNFNEKPLSTQDKIQEFIFLCLRHKNGIEKQHFQKTTGQSICALPLQRLIDEGYLQETKTHIRATIKGWRFLNYVEQVLLIR